MKTFLLALCHLAAAAHGWSCSEAPRLYDVVQVDAGQGKVVARDRDGTPYFLSGASWFPLGSLKLKHVSVGPSGLWGIDASDQAVKYIAGDFQQVRGLALQHVDAGGDGHVLGIQANSAQTYCLARGLARDFDGVGALNWTTMPNVWFRTCSCSPDAGCWGVLIDSEVRFSTGVDSSSCASSSWTSVSDLNMQMIKVGSDGSVFGLSTNGNAYERTGVSGSRPQGSGWSVVSLCMKVTHLSYDLGRLWLATPSGLLLQCSR